MTLEPMSLFWLALTLLAYLGSRWLYRRTGRYLLSPLILVPVVLLAVAVPLHTGYAEYARNTHWLMSVLGPVTVAFAVPIWQQRALLARHWPALSLGMLVGSAASIGSSWALAHALSLDNQVSLSLLPRSITTPFAMPLAHDLGGVPELTAVFVMFTGVLGALMGGVLLSTCPCARRWHAGRCSGWGRTAPGSAEPMRWAAKRALWRGW
jgi:putative effector of murein hydrolase